MNNFFIHESAIVDAGAKIGAGTKIWHFTHVMGTAEIGENCVLGQNVFVGNKAKLGNNVKVQNNVSLYEGVVCEDDVFLGPSMVFTNVINPRSTVNRKEEFKKTLVKKGVSIGANATIVCGITLGEYCFIGAGAVVTNFGRQFGLSRNRRTVYLSRQLSLS
jgi:UDP-2-acetamido-3-amino-2,3-dideoxy-glucuronate N-acetyltransferase